VAKAVLIGAVPPQMLKTAIVHIANPLNSRKDMSP